MGKDTILAVSFILLVVGFLEIVITKKNRHFFQGVSISCIGIFFFVFLSIGTNLYESFSNAYGKDITEKVTEVIKNNPTDNNFIQYEAKKAMKEYVDNYNDNILLTNIKIATVDSKDNDGKEPETKTVKISCDFSWYFLKLPMKDKTVIIQINQS